jgi:hypothetical protein
VTVIYVRMSMLVCVCVCVYVFMCDSVSVAPFYYMHC